MNCENPFRVLLAFDSFKGSISSQDACAAVSEALRARFGSDVVVRVAPMADGGEGSLDVLASGAPQAEVHVTTVDARGRPTSAMYLWDPETQAASIEVASVIGLPRVSDLPLNALEATSFGLGALIRDAVERGAVSLNIFLGGSATIDGGVGMLEALGYRFLDARGNHVVRGGSGLEAIESIELSRDSDLYRRLEWTFITDVDAPLLGPYGSALMYGPQKGASPDEVNRLEEGMKHLVEWVARDFGQHIGEIRGLGAAGGVAAMATVLCGGRIVHGGDFFVAHHGLESHIGDSDLVITGEGRCDLQSWQGKVVGTIANIAHKGMRHVPVVVIAGSISPDVTHMENGVTASFSLAEGPSDVTSMMEGIVPLLNRRAVNIVSLSMAMRSWFAL